MSMVGTNIFVVLAYGDWGKVVSIYRWAWHCCVNEVRILVSGKWFMVLHMGRCHCDSVCNWWKQDVASGFPTVCWWYGVVIVVGTDLCDLGCMCHVMIRASIHCCLSKCCGSYENNSC